MPETMAIPLWRNRVSVSPQAAGDSRNGSSASWTRRMPVVSSLATRSFGSAGCSDQLHTARRASREVLLMQKCLRKQLVNGVHNFVLKPASKTRGFVVKDHRPAAFVTAFLEDAFGRNVARHIV